MHERPILFNGAMVRAILDGRKTVTRRAVIKASQPETIFPSDFSATEAMVELNSTVHGTTWWKACPYGKPGDRLWVRETFAVYGDEKFAAIHYRADRPHDVGRKGVGYKPSIHMPRWACRLVLEVTDVRVERLQAITYEQAAAEGVQRDQRMWFATDEGGTAFQYPEQAFAQLWRQTGGDWDANPWVWVVEFKRVEVANVR